MFCHSLAEVVHVHVALADVGRVELDGEINIHVLVREARAGGGDKRFAERVHLRSKMDTLVTQY